MTNAVEPQWMRTLGEEAGIEAATALYRETFGGEPEYVVAAPGRVNLIGEHVDYAGGISVPFALLNRAYVAASRRDDNVLRVTSKGADPAVVEVRADDVKPGNPDNWAGYVIGAIWAAQQAGIIPEGGLDAAMVSDVPLGAGLSSSAAIECAAIAAAAALTGTEMNDKFRAAAVPCAMRAENEIVGASTGGMDQRISLLGKEANALAINFLTDTDTLVPFDIADAGYTLVVANTNAPHSLADGQYASRRAVIDGVAEHAGVATLAEVDEPYEQAGQWAADTCPDNLTHEQWNDVVHRRVRHVISEIERTGKAVESLQKGDLEAFGKAMWESHASLRDDYEVSTPELDLVVECAKECGALGARMTGGGFGGSAIALIASGDVDKLVQLIADKADERGYPAPEFLAATPGAGARVLRARD